VSGSSGCETPAVVVKSESVFNTEEVVTWGRGRGRFRGRGRENVTNRTEKNGQRNSVDKWKY